MIRQVVELASDGMFINKERGFLVISQGEEKSSIPLSDIAVLLCTSQRLSFTKQALMALNENGAPVVFCGNSYKPESLMLPIAGNYEHSGRLQEQILVSVPLKKQLWKTIVTEKINNQALALQHLELIGKIDYLKKQADSVTSGDATNREAVAAKVYWDSLFGKSFTRNLDGDGINAFLNYGYSVLRGVIARAVSSVGLHPSLGLHHSNKLNAYCLVDDLMEPFRPIVDLYVYQLSQHHTELDFYSKQVLQKISHVDLLVDKGRSPLVKAAEYYTTSLTKSFRSKRNELCIPSLIKEEVLEQTSPLPF